MEWLSARFSSLVTARATVPATSFHRFGDLPPEIRLKIWRQYFLIRRIHVVPTVVTNLPFVRPAFTETPVLTLNHVWLEAGTNRPLDRKAELAGFLVDSAALDLFRKHFELADLKCLRSSVPLSDHEDLRGQIARFNSNNTVLPRGHEAMQESIKMTMAMEELAEKVLESVNKSVYRCPPVNFDLDLVYLTNARTPNILGRFWSKPWTHKVQRIALLIADRTAGAEWSEDTLHDVLKQYERGGPRVADFAVKEIYLVILPDSMPKNRFGKLVRDDYGFIPYDANTWAHMGSWWNLRMSRQYGSIDSAFKSRCPDLMATTKIKWVIDIDNREGYEKERTSERYSRFLR